MCTILLVWLIFYKSYVDVISSIAQAGFLKTLIIKIAEQLQIVDSSREWVSTCVRYITIFFSQFFYNVSRIYQKV